MRVHVSASQLRTAFSDIKFYFVLLTIILQICNFSQQIQLENISSVCNIETYCTGNIYSKKRNPKEYDSYVNSKDVEEGGKERYHSTQYLLVFVVLDGSYKNC